MQKKQRKEVQTCNPEASKLVCLRKFVASTAVKSIAVTQIAGSRDAMIQNSNSSLETECLTRYANHSPKSME